MFHITIGSAPKPDLSLEEDLRMVKTSLLYGDHVKLCSGTYSSLLPWVELTNYTPEQRIDFFERISNIPGYKSLSSHWLGRN